MKITLKNGFTQEQFKAKIEEMFKINGYKKLTHSCDTICKEYDKKGCHHCVISFHNSGWGASDILVKHFPILERKLKLKKLLEE